MNRAAYKPSRGLTRQAGAHPPAQEHPFGEPSVKPAQRLSNGNPKRTWATSQCNFSGRGGVSLTPASLLTTATGTRRLYLAFTASAWAAKQTSTSSNSPSCHHEASPLTAHCVRTSAQPRRTSVQPLRRPSPPPPPPHQPTARLPLPRAPRSPRTAGTASTPRGAWSMRQDALHGPYQCCTPDPQGHRCPGHPWSRSEQSWLRGTRRSELHHHLVLAKMADRCLLP
mmetsp:Transcript_72456/g.207856  ORF Transcript_72456/g.207856 Transcript_72456/m.207856 type:complete len:226 (-) Transcript_72456:457-1134(-)